MPEPEIKLLILHLNNSLTVDWTKSDCQLFHQLMNTIKNKITYVNVAD